MKLKGRTVYALACALAMGNIKIRYAAPALFAMDWRSEVIDPDTLLCDVFRVVVYREDDGQLVRSCTCGEPACMHLEAVEWMWEYRPDEVVPGQASGDSPVKMPNN